MGKIDNADLVRLAKGNKIPPISRVRERERVRAI